MLMRSPHGRPGRVSPGKQAVSHQRDREGPFESRCPHLCDTRRRSWAHEAYPREMALTPDPVSKAAATDNDRFDPLSLTVLQANLRNHLAEAELVDFPPKESF